MLDPKSNCHFRSEISRQWPCLLCWRTDPVSGYTSETAAQETSYELSNHCYIVGGWKAFLAHWDEVFIIVNRLCIDHTYLTHFQSVSSCREAWMHSFCVYFPSEFPACVSANSQIRVNCTFCQPLKPGVNSETQVFLAEKLAGVYYSASHHAYVNPLTVCQ